MFGEVREVQTCHDACGGSTRKLFALIVSVQPKFLFALLDSAARSSQPLRDIKYMPHVPSALPGRRI